MKKRTIINTVLVLVMGLTLVLGAACTGEQGQPGVGIDSIVNNGNGTLTVTLTDGSSFTTDNLTGLQGIPGPKGDTGSQRSLTAVGSSGHWEGRIPWHWDESEASFHIDADGLPSLRGSGFEANKTVQINLVVAPTSGIPMATVTTNSIGCFHVFLSQVEQAGDPIRVAPDAGLDGATGTSVSRDCYFEVVGGPEATTLPVWLYGPGPQTQADQANAEMVTAQAAIESCLADANAAHFTSGAAWDGTRATSPTVKVSDNVTYYASDFLRHPSFKATYAFDVNGQLLVATLIPAPGETAWVGIRWDPSTCRWVNA